MITTKKANFYIHKINRQEKSYEWKKKKSVFPWNQYRLFTTIMCCNIWSVQ